MNTQEPFQGSGDRPVVAAGSQRTVSGTFASVDLAVEAARSRAVADCEDRLHAVRSGLAGLSGAVHLLTDQGADLPEASRRRLEGLLVAEVDRLRRVVASPATGERVAVVEDLELDVVVGHVVLGRRMAGQEVAWTPSGRRVRGRADDLTEALNVLLVNAWRHAEGAPARIEASCEDASVLIKVSDDGPGVLPELRQSIFERGVRRPGSRGQGLGLAMARDLVESLGGSLTLSPCSHGACFCLALPSVGREAA